jgi:polyhydroxybutyrate depolymerase
MGLWAHKGRAFRRRRRREAAGALLGTALLGAGFLGFLGFLGACSSGGGSNGTAGGATTTSSSTATRGTDPPVTPNLDGRAYTLITPPNIDKATPAPLLIMIHGYTDGSKTSAPWTDMDTYMRISPETMSRGWLLALGHGNLDPTLNHYYWNGTDACCDLEGSNPDDVGYVLGVIADIEKTYAVDPKRIFILGHSNDGFMTNRLACDFADKFAAVISLAGETYLNQTKCEASAPIAYLQVQGDADMTVPYAGGHPEGISALPNAPGAVETTQDWAKKNGCSTADGGADMTEPQIQLMTSSTGPETTKIAYDKCQANGWAELWTIHGGPHSPPFVPQWAQYVCDWLSAHPRP